MRELRPPSGKRTAGSPISIHIGRGAPRQAGRCAGLTCSHGASGALDLYWEVGRPLECEYELELWLATPDGIAGGFGFDSFKRDFSERDKLVLDLLQPHLVQLWYNAAARRRDSRSLAALTPREREVLLWVARGKSNREIAAILYLAPGTIRKHLDNLYDKLGVSNRAGAVGHAYSIETDTFADQSADSRLRP